MAGNLWEYKGKHANLDAAFNQLRQYALALENPPLLIVSDVARFRIRTNWTNSVSETHAFTLDDLADAAIRDKLKRAMSGPERLRPGESRQALTERAAATFAALAQSLRERGHEPQAVAHFVNRLVFCMFAEDVGMLRDNMFTRMLERARLRPERFGNMARTLFGAVATGGEIGFETVDWFSGTGPRLDVDRRDSVDALQRLCRLARSDPEAAGHHRMPRRGADAGGRRTGVAGRRRGGGQPAVFGKQKAPK